jgi:hypothetical protein
MRGGGAEVCGVAGEHCRVEVEAERAVGMEERFEQGVAEEAGAAGDEEVGVGESGEGGTCVFEDVGEVVDWEGLHGHYF